MFNLNICHLYPELLNTYGDKGNITALVKRCEWRDIDAKVTHISIGDKFDAENYDIIFLGGGQDYEQEILQADLLFEKGNELKNAVNSNKVFLCICGGFQLMGKYLKNNDNKEIEFLGAINIWTINSEEKFIGNLVFEAELNAITQENIKIIGFENHSGRTFLGPDVRPLGKVIKGNGNNGKDGYEGAIYKNVYCTYAHGSLLPKNPVLADHLIKIALKEKYGFSNALGELDDSFENAAHDSVISRVLG